LVLYQAYLWKIIMRVKNNKAKPQIKESIVASKNVKVFMKLDDPDATFDLFEKWREEQFFAPVQHSKTIAKL
jgi:hypothetical protein